MEEIQTKTTTTENNVDKQIVSVNEFLEFMNLSCRLNDLINNGRVNSTNNNNNNNNNTQQTINKTRKSCTFLPAQQQQHNKERYTTNLAHTTTGGRRGQFDIDLKKLAQNALINNIYEFVQPPQATAGVQEDASDAQNIKDSKIKTFTQRVNNGLHPLLSDKLEYVINEGILDAVLPFICPVTLPSVANINARNLKNKHINNNNNNNNNTGQASNNTLLTKDSRLLACPSMSLAGNCSSMDLTCQGNESEVSTGVCTKLSFVANSNARRKSLGAGKSNCSLLPKE